MANSRRRGRQRRIAPPATLAERYAFVLAALTGDLLVIVGVDLVVGGDRIEVFRRPLRLEVTDHLLDLVVGDEGAVDALDAAAAHHVEHVALAEELLGALLAEDGARID